MIQRWFAALLLLSLAVTTSAIDSVQPSQIAIASTVGAIETRSLVLSTDAALTNIQVYTQDLLSEDGTHIIPANEITVATLPSQLAANSRTPLPVTIDLSNMQSGRYTGEVVVHHDDGDLIVPLSVTVKHGWLGAAVALVLGLLGGMWSTLYRQNGLPRDDLLVKKVAVTQGLAAEKDDLLPRLRQRIEANLYDADRALEAREWTTARTALNEATRLWHLWGSERGSWLQQMQEYKRLAQYFNTPQLTLPQKLRHSVEMLDAETPQALYEQLVLFQGQINSAVALAQKIEDLNLMRRDREDEMLRTRVQQLGQALISLDMGDAEAVAAFQTQIDKATPTTESMSVRSTPLAQILSVNKWPSLSPTQAPYLRRSLFWTITYIGVLFTLFIMGYQQLYQANPIFGANLLIDYGALFLFGFTGEVALAAFTRASGE